ncbi:alpha/beta fold hydrolase [Microbacterium gorillae]|uniref:alpha/beta fold hydrolase n=1 Tax=Microbacterium gorillae TaxID=1231063 RepID=UPI00059081A6|nr:alpha/beta fold hydrolase [Microbacterium gorillae]
MDVYVTNARRDPQQAWPHRLAGPGSVAAIDLTAPATDAATVIADHLTADTTIFAHSYTAVPALLAAGRRPVAALVLVEPAFYDLARDDASVAQHIDTVTAARRHLAGGDIRGYWEVLRPLMFGGPLEAARWAEEEPAARAFAARTLPWGHDLPTAVIGRVPTLVITGGWNPEYEAIAERLVGLGAHHRTLPGHDHRAQDHPDFADMVTAFRGT